MYKCTECGGEILAIFGVSVERSCSILSKWDDRNGPKMETVENIDYDDGPDFQECRCKKCGKVFDAVNFELFFYTYDDLWVEEEEGSENV
jgi:hypothetical protein